MAKKFRGERMTAAKSAGGRGMVKNSFFTLTALLVTLLSVTFAYAASPVTMGTAADFAVLAATTVTNTGPTDITGDLGLSPGSAITGFPPGIVHGATHAADSIALQAQTDLVAAYDDAASRTCDTTYTGSKDLVGLTLVPGVYCADDFTLSGTLTLDGDATDVWIFKSASTLITSGTANVILSTSGEPCYVWWQVGSSATLGTNTLLAGNILALTSISLATGANLNGRALARNGAVTLDTNNIFSSSCGSPPPPPPPPPGVPEFTPFALGLAVVGAGLGLALLRKK